jgi:hypothetical protein
VRNNKRYVAFYPVVPQAFLEVSDLHSQFLAEYLLYLGKCVHSSSTKFSSGHAGYTTIFLVAQKSRTWRLNIARFHFFWPHMRIC